MQVSDHQSIVGDPSSREGVPGAQNCDFRKIIDPPLIMSVVIDVACIFGDVVVDVACTFGEVHPFLKEEG